MVCRIKLVAAEHTQTELKATRRLSFNSSYETVLEKAGRMILSANEQKTINNFLVVLPVLCIYESGCPTPRNVNGFSEGGNQRITG